MKVLTARNVNEAAYLGTMELVAVENSGRTISPRGFTTVEYPGPVCTEYVRPWERVLFLEARDANPFFHLMEAMWILAGRNDVAFLTKFNKRMAEFSDDGETFHAPYGYRLRKSAGDQIWTAIQMLKADPDTRQAVLQIWNARDDLGVFSRDIPCNDLLFLKVRDGRLNLTVCCRSNDMLWGAYGANAVQFSFIQEYVAAHLGVEMGTYHQISDSFHVYLDGPGGALWDRVKRDPFLFVLEDKYTKNQCESTPLLAAHETPAMFDADLDKFFSTDDDGVRMETLYQTRFFNNTVLPVLVTWVSHKDSKKGYIAADGIQASDWRAACKSWCERREL